MSASDRADLTADHLRALLHYDPKTGVFRWRVRRGGTANPGSVAGRANDRGYVCIWIWSREYRAHQLAWLYMTGAWAPVVVDHADTDPSNNRWSNLRAATFSQNNANRRVNSNNLLGIKGVDRRPGGKFRARVWFNGRNFDLGLHDTVEAAAEAYRVAARRLHGEFARFE